MHEFHCDFTLLPSALTLPAPNVTETLLCACHRQPLHTHASSRLPATSTHIFSSAGATASKNSSSSSSNELDTVSTGATTISNPSVLAPVSGIGCGSVRYCSVTGKRARLAESVQGVALAFSGSPAALIAEKDIRSQNGYLSDGHDTFSEESCLSFDATALDKALYLNNENIPSNTRDNADSSLQDASVGTHTDGSDSDNDGLDLSLANQSGHTDAVHKSPATEAIALPSAPAAAQAVVVARLPRSLLPTMYLTEPVVAIVPLTASALRGTAAVAALSTSSFLPATTTPGVHAYTGSGASASAAAVASAGAGVGASAASGFVSVSKMQSQARDCALSDGVSVAGLLAPAVGISAGATVTAAPG